MPWISLVHFHQVTPQPSISMFVISLCKTSRDPWGTDRQMRVTWLFPAPHGGRRAKKHPKNPGKKGLETRGRFGCTWFSRQQCQPGTSIDLYSLEPGD